MIFWASSDRPSSAFNRISRKKRGKSLHVAEESSVQILQISAHGHQLGIIPAKAARQGDRRLLCARQTGKSSRMHVDHEEIQ